MEDLSQCAGREGFLEAEELVPGGGEEVGCQSWEGSDSGSPAHPDPLPSCVSCGLGWLTHLRAWHVAGGRDCVCV